MSDSETYGVSSTQGQNALAIYKDDHPHLVKNAGPFLRRAIAVEDNGILQTALKFQDRSKSAWKSDAALVYAALLIRVSEKRRLQDTVLEKIEKIGEIRMETIRASIKRSSRWGERNFLEFIENINEYHNRKAKELRPRLKKAIKAAAKLETLLTDNAELSSESDNSVAKMRADIQEALDKAPLPKHLPQPRLVLSEALWPIFKDHGLTVLEGASLLARSCSQQGASDFIMPEAEVQSFRQAILKVNRTLR